MKLAKIEKTLRKLSGAKPGMAAAFEKRDLLDAGVTEAMIKSWCDKLNLSAEWDTFACNLIFKNGQAGFQAVSKAFGY